MPFATLAELLHHRAAWDPERLGWRYLSSGDVDGPIEELRWGELLRRASAGARALAEHAKPGDRALRTRPRPPRCRPWSAPAPHTPRRPSWTCLTAS